MAVYDYIGTPLEAVFGAEGNELEYAYDASGVEVYSKGTPPTPPEPPEPPTPPIYPIGLDLLHSSYPGVNSPQGMATFGNYIFQFFSNVNEIHIYNKEDFSEINSIPCTVIGHGNSLQFGKAVQSNGFPYLYCSGGRNIYVLSIDLYRLSLVDTIVLSADVGNSGNSVIDFDNEIIYSVAYTATSIYDTTGKHRVSALSLNNPSTVITSWEYNYLGVIQGVVWDGHHIVVNCNTYNGQYVKFHFINPSTQILDKTEQFAKEYQAPLDSEYQGFSFEETYYLVSKWVYKDYPNARSLYYEFYSYVPDWGDEQSLVISKMRRPKY